MTARACRGPNPGSVQQLFCAPHATDRLALLFFEDFPTTSDFGTSRSFARLQRRLLPEQIAVSFPKIPSDLNWHHEVESLHRRWRCLRSFMQSGCSSPPCSSRVVGLKPRTSFSVIS